MRQFFTECLQNLKVLRGLNQYEDYLSKGERGIREMNDLIQHLISISNSFNYIPIDVQQNTIKKRIIEDPELFNLNASKIWSWLNAISNRYYFTSEQEKVSYKSSNEEISPSTQAMIQQFINDLSAGGGLRSVPAVSPNDIKKIQIEDEQRTHGLSTGLKYGTPEQDRIRELKMEYGRIHADPYTGRTKPGHPTLQEYLKTADNPDSTIGL
jgi:hypothetical protein